MSIEEAARPPRLYDQGHLQDPLRGNHRSIQGREVFSADFSAPVVGDVAEDSLRVLRAAQFAARFEFEDRAATLDLCRSIDSFDLPAERIWGKWKSFAARPATLRLDFSGCANSANRPTFPD